MNGIATRFDEALLALERRIRAQPLLYRLTLGTRLLLAAGFVPTGLVKLLGQRFTALGADSPIGAFFEALYQSGPYWRFLGFAQVLAGLCVLIPATATLGGVLFFGILANIFVITLAFDFRGTPFVTGAMLLAALYLLIWDYHRLRGLLGFESPAPGFAGAPAPRLAGRFERGVYVAGASAGMLFFLGTRGLGRPQAASGPLLIAGLAAVVVALGLGWRHRRAATTHD